METVTRIRRTPGGRDLNGDRLPSTEDRKTLRARAVAPGSSSPYQATGRDGESVTWTIYFTRPVDVEDGDRIEVRGTAYQARVSEWRSAFGTGRRGLVVEATRKAG